MKTLYQIDNQNNLIIKRKKQKIIPRGNFKITADNRLNFWLNEPTTWLRKYNLPKRIEFLGKWSLNSNYDLELYLYEGKNLLQKNPLVLKGEIISAQAESLSFLIKTEDKRGVQKFKILKLNGYWQADEYNRINFLVEKKEDIPDTLIFKNAWQINPNQKITYTYQKTNLLTKNKTQQTIEFEGFWQINSSHKLTYILSGGNKSYFDFRIQKESLNLYPEDGKIKYRIGIGIKKEKMQTIYLYGTWKFSKKGALLFEMDYGEGRIKAIEFSPVLNITKKDTISFSLYNFKNEPLGITINFFHRFLKELDAEFYLKIKNQLKEKAINVGVNIPF